MSDNFTKFKLDWLDKVARDPAITHFAFRVAYVLASTFLNRRTGTAWPSHETLARRVNRTEEGVRQAIRQLVKAGHLERDEEARGRGHTNVYRLVHKNRDGHTGIGNVNGSKKTGTAKTKKPGWPHRKTGIVITPEPFEEPLEKTPDT